jgi:hypothetical protein
MSYELDSIEHKGLTIRIVNDESPEEPDWGDEELFLVYTGRKYSFGREAPTDSENHLKWGEGKWGEFGAEIPDQPAQGGESEAYDLYEEWCSEYDSTYLVFPYRCGDAHGPGSFCIWLMDLDDLRRGDPHGWIYVKNPGGPLEQLANLNFNPDKLVEGLIENYQTWANGDVWGFIIEDADGVELESCWGFYGSDSCIEAGKEAADGIMGHSRNVKLVVLLDESSTWEYLTQAVPLAVSDSQAPAWALETKLADKPDILGVMLASNLMTQEGLVLRKQEKQG